MKQIVDYPVHQTLTDDLLKDGGSVIIVHFHTGYYEQPSPEALEAQARIQAALNAISDEDLKLYREWDGNVTHYGMHARAVNPDITEQEMEDMAAAAAKHFTNYTVGTTWKFGQHGLTGVSVRMHRKRS